MRTATAQRQTTDTHSFDQLREAWDTLHAEAERLSGTSTSKEQRAAVYYRVYEDSEGNFMFPLVATHGSLWGVTHTQRIERWLRRTMLPLSRHGRVQRWIDALDMVRDINRRVFVEIYTTFYFTREHGRHALAAEFVKPDILEPYNRVHDAIMSGRPLTRSERRDVYYTVFVHEQDDIVDPGIHEAMALVEPWFVGALRVVKPRFRYFPRRERLHFTDFTDVEQRNREGLRALAFAEEVGPERVREAMSEY